MRPAESGGGGPFGAFDAIGQWHTTVLGHHGEHEDAGSVTRNCVPVQRGLDAPEVAQDAVHVITAKHTRTARLRRVGGGAALVLVEVMAEVLACAFARLVPAVRRRRSPDELDRHHDEKQHQEPAVHTHLILAPTSSRGERRFCSGVHAVIGNPEVGTESSIHIKSA